MDFPIFDPTEYFDLKLQFGNQKVNVRGIEWDTFWNKFKTPQPILIETGGTSRIHLVQYMGTSFVVKEMFSVERASIEPTKFDVINTVISAGKMMRNVVKIYDWFVIEAEPDWKRIIFVFVMEYIVGISLSDYSIYMKDLRDPVSFSSKQLDEMTTALILTINEFHKKNIIHRDIKPGNVMVRSEELFNAFWVFKNDMIRRGESAYEIVRKVIPTINIPESLVLIDFDVSCVSNKCKINPDIKQAMFTISYLPPELLGIYSFLYYEREVLEKKELQGEEISSIIRELFSYIHALFSYNYFKAADVWSLAVTLYKIAFLDYPYLSMQLGPREKVINVKKLYRETLIGPTESTIIIQRANLTMVFLDHVLIQGTRAEQRITLSDFITSYLKQPSKRPKTELFNRFGTKDILFLTFNQRKFGAIRSSQDDTVRLFDCEKRRYTCNHSIDIDQLLSFHELEFGEDAQVCPLCE